MAKVMVKCNACDTEFDSGYNVPETVDLTTNKTQCKCGNMVELTKDNVRFE